MPNLKDIRTRIASVKNTQKITSAMKMVSAAKLRRAQAAAEAARPYAIQMTEVIRSLAGRVESSSHELLERRELEKKVLLIVVSSNRGLCGGFNANIFRAIRHWVTGELQTGLEISVATVGRKAQQFYKRRDLPVYREYEDVIGSVSHLKAKRIAAEVTGAFLEGEYDLVYLVYNEFISAIAYETRIDQLLPLPVAASDVETTENDVEYLYEPSAEYLFEHLLPSFVDVQVLHALLESEASEHSARMAAMDSATNNASDMIKSLTLQYNRARQAYITKELVEIVSGAEALKG